MVVTEAQSIGDLIGSAVEIIHGAGKEALSYYGRGRPDVKFDEELITEAGLHLSDFFEDRLSADFPGHQIFSNNREDRGYTHKSDRYLWVFDPLDGVANFQGRIPIWGISLALLENYWPVFGAFHMPVTGDFFHARAGQKAYWGATEIHPTGHPDINDESVLLVYSRFHDHYHASFPGKIRNLGCTAAHLCYVASGRAEAAVIAHQTYQDLAAVRVIIEAAGLRLYNMDGAEFFLNEYLEGKTIDQDLLVTAPESRTLIYDSLQPII